MILRRLCEICTLSPFVQYNEYDKVNAPFVLLINHTRTRTHDASTQNKQKQTSVYANKQTHIMFLV